MMYLLRNGGRVITSLNLPRSNNLCTTYTIHPPFPVHLDHPATTSMLILSKHHNCCPLSPLSSFQYQTSTSLNFLPSFSFDHMEKFGTKTLCLSSVPLLNKYERKYIKTSRWVIIDIWTFALKKYKLKN